MPAVAQQDHPRTIGGWRKAYSSIGPCVAVDRPERSPGQLAPHQRGGVTRPALLPHDAHAAARAHRLRRAMQRPGDRQLKLEDDLAARVDLEHDRPGVAHPRARENQVIARRAQPGGGDRDRPDGRRHAVGACRKQARRVVRVGERDEHPVPEHGGERRRANPGAEPVIWGDPLPAQGGRGGG